MPVVATEDFSGALDTTLQGKTTTTGGLVWSGVGAFSSSRSALKLTGAGRLKNTVAEAGASVNTGSANHYAQGVWYNIQTTNNYTGLLLSVVDHNNYILVAPLGNATVRIIKRIGGTTTVVNTISTPLSDGVLVRAEKADGVVKVYKDGVQIGLTTGYSIPDAAVATSTNAGIWGQAFTAGADIMDDFEAGTLGGVEPPSLTIGSGPAVNQIYQRSPGATSKPVPVSGTYGGEAPADLQAQIETVVGTVVSAWATIAGATIGSGAWSASVAVPQRPEWLVLRVRSRDAGGVVLASAVTGQFGVGVLAMIDGQSNGVGLGSVTGGSAPSVPFAKWNGSAWATSINGAGERAFVQELASQTGVIVGIGNSAANGTDIASHTPPSSTNWTNTANMIAAMGGDCELLLWSQGESNAAAGSDVSAAYSTALQSIAAGMLTLTGRTAAQFRVLVGVTGRNDGGSGTDVGWQSVRVGQASAAAASAAIDISHDCIDLPMADTLHYSSAGYLEAGYRFARSALRWLGFGVYDARGPRIASASRSGDVVTVEFDLNGSASLTGTGTLTGWEFYNGSSWAAATDATRVGNTVTFTGAGATSVRYLYGADPDVSNLARGNLTPSASSSVGLPVEPARAAVPVSALGVDVTVSGQGGTIKAGTGAVSVDLLALPVTVAVAGSGLTIKTGAGSVSVDVLALAPVVVSAAGVGATLKSGAGAVSVDLIAVPPGTVTVQASALGATAKAGYGAVSASVIAMLPVITATASGIGMTSKAGVGAISVIEYIPPVAPTGAPLLSVADPTTYLSIAGR